MNLYLRPDGALTFAAPVGGKAYREYISDPANPVPYRARPISPTYPEGDWPTWETDDQRFVDHRPDVLTYVSAPLEKVNWRRSCMHRHPDPPVQNVIRPPS
jgi:uncharacterized protein